MDVQRGRVQPRASDAPQSVATQPLHVPHEAQRLRFGSMGMAGLERAAQCVWKRGCPRLVACTGTGRTAARRGVTSCVCASRDQLGRATPPHASGLARTTPTGRPSTLCIYAAFPTLDALD